MPAVRSSWTSACASCGPRRNVSTMDVENWDVKDDGALCHMIERKSHGFTAEVRLWVEVEIDGKLYGTERVVRLALKREPRHREPAG